MIEDYNAAKKLAEEAVKAAARNNESPNLPVLEIPGEKVEQMKVVKLGLMELPLSRIVGNKESSRNNAFANNFMPLLESNSEFAVKWSRLYDSFLQEGIRDAVIVYEYMNKYYVQEGNKRVSVSKYADVEYILADVRRIIPTPKETAEYKVYSEYMDFYDCTKNPYIVFSKAGDYQRLADLLGEDLEHEWDESSRIDLKSAYFTFCKRCTAVLKITDHRALADAFLMYISIFPMKTIFRDSEEQLIKNIKLAKTELIAGSTLAQANFLDSVPEAAEKKSMISKLFSTTKRYTASSPLKVAFIYDTDIEQSRWIDSHEAGRLYVDEMTGDNVVTKAYQDTKGDTGAAIAKAVREGCDIVFTVSPEMMNDSVKAAIQYPNVKILNCSFGNTASTVRCYFGKLYEAAFLMGVLAADKLLCKYGSDGVHRIGYLSRSSDNFSIHELNAFAIGVSMIDPECRISLKSRIHGVKHKEEWKAEGVRIYADFDSYYDIVSATRPGLYEMTDEKEIYLGKPFFSWGKYYVQIVQSVLSGAWTVGEKMGMNNAANYWFGLSTGVVDIIAPKLPYQTNKLLSFMKNTIVNGGFDPFTGEIRAQDGTLVQESSSGTRVSVEHKKMNTNEIAVMKWLNENIDGRKNIG